MKNRLSLLLIIATFLIAIPTNLFSQKTQKYSSDWKQVEYYVEKQRPESALKVVDKILKKAEKRNEYPQIIKAMMYQVRCKVEKNPDDEPKLLKDFEKKSLQFKDPVARSVGLFLTAQLLYKNDKEIHFKTRRNRTILKGEKVPENMEEWSLEMIENKIKSLNQQWLKNKEALLQTDVLTYADIFKEKKVDSYLTPTVFHFLVYNYNELDERKKLYDELIAFDKKKGNIPALIYCQLQKIELTYPEKDDNYFQAFNKLEKEYSENEFVVEVLAKKANYLYTNNKRREAYNVVEKGLKKFPKYRRISLLENIRTNILNKSLKMYFSEKHARPYTLKPKTKTEITVATRNISKVQVLTYRTTLSPEKVARYANLNNNYDFKKHWDLIESKDLQIKKGNDFGIDTTVFQIKTKNYGVYKYVVREPKTKAEVSDIILVTDFVSLSKTLSETSLDLFSLDKIEGTPIKNVSVKVYDVDRYESRFNLIKKVKTDKEGLAELRQIYKEIDNVVFIFQKGKDKYYYAESGLNYYGDSKPNKEDELSLFTDRSLYRAGQTVYFKGIVFNRWKQKVVPNKIYTVKLFDTNYKEVAKKEMKTNSFGSFAGNFVLPQSVLNGQYHIRVDRMSSTYFSVEDYKRPTFEVEIKKPKKEVRFGQKMTIKGTANSYAGFPMSNAKVKYKITRGFHYFCWWLWNYDDNTVIADGEVKTNSKGEFELQFLAEKDKEKKYENEWWYRTKGIFYTYHITTDVTDAKGETQSAEQYFSVGDKALFITNNIPARIDKNDVFEQKIDVQTINGDDVVSKVNYQVIRLKPSTKYYEDLAGKYETEKEKRDREELKTVLKGTFSSDKKLKLNLKKLPAGQYKFRFTTKDNRGNKIESEQIRIIYSKADKTPAVKMYEWLLTSKTEVNVGEKVTIHYGTSTQNTSVLYEIMRGNKILERRWIKFNNEIKKFTIPYKKEYKNGIVVSFTFVKNGELYNQNIRITKKEKSKIEHPLVKVFRDKLQPNAKETWTISVPNTKSKERAELLISMYDASLDAIKKHWWAFNPSFYNTLPRTSWWRKNYSYSIPYKNQFYFPTNIVYPTPFNIPRILNWTNGLRRELMAGSVMMRSTAFTQDDLVEPVGELEEVVTVFGNKSAKPEIKKVGAISSKKESKKVKKSEKKKAKIKVRENFNETAFFYPQLRTDKKGNVKIEFTVPEALTRWNVNLLSHTKNLYFGQNQVKVVTQKELMVQMNLPRFIRQNDKLTLMANVVNLSKKSLIADVTLQIIDPKTEKTIFTKTKSHQSLSIDESKAVEWQLPKLNYDLVIVRVTAKSDRFSDGEQKYLPILPNKILVTETMPMTIRKNETRRFNVSRFVENWKNVETKNFTVEFGTNPVWYAIQALPTVAEPKCENAIDYLSAYYVNRLANHIVTQNPKIKTVFTQWKKEKNSNALISNLSKNKELKNMQLEETPWVLDAENETQQKQQIATLFNLNEQQNNANHYLDKLFDLQNYKGGFSWIKGFSQSRYITQKILLQLARIERLTGKNSDKEYQANIKRAIRYLDFKIAEDFETLKKVNPNYYKQNVIGNTQLFYLHVRSEYPHIPIDKSARNAVNFYTGQAEKYWTDFTLYGKAMMALVNYRNKNQFVTNEILTSLKENAMKTDELGMYWVKNRAGWFWYERPVAIQSAIIDAWVQTKRSEKDVEEMKIWLLKQKQTQRWNSSESTIDAIYSLLQNGENWISQSGKTTVLLNQKVLNDKNKETATGYFKTRIPMRELTNKKANITIKSKDSSLGWGSVYWQYFQDADKVKTQGKELHVEKKMFVEKIVNGKKVIVPKGKSVLQKGDKVVIRLVVKTDRNLNYVSLKDLRAGCFEPLEQISRVKYRSGTRFYQTTKDTSTQFFFEFLPKGTYVFEYEAWANNTGEFTSGTATLQCMYAPEFSAHSKGEKVTVK